MDFSNNYYVSDNASFVSSTTPQYNTVPLPKKGNVYAITEPVHTDNNVTSIMQVGKTSEKGATEKASFYIYGNKKNNLLDDITKILVTIVQEQDTLSFVSVTNLKAPIHFDEDIDLEIGKY